MKKVLLFISIIPLSLYKLFELIYLTFKYFFNKYKKIFLTLFVGLIGLINFGYCENISDLIDYAGTFTNKTVDYNYSTLLKLNGDHEIKSICVKFTNYIQGSRVFIGFSMSDGGTPVRNFEYANNGIYVCFDYYADGYLVARSNTIENLDGDVFVLSDLLTTAVPKLTSLQCQTEYNLIPVSSVDQNYCLNNNLCPSQGDCPDNPGDYTGDLIYSNIYINDILHPGKQNIFINIPDYITWDYSQNEVDFNVYVGSGYDVDYINSIVDINSYRPTSNDFTNVFVSGLTLIFPYIFVALLILFIWKLLKRIFK